MEIADQSHPLPTGRSRGFDFYKTCHCKLVLDIKKALFYSTRLAFCPGLDYSLFPHGDITISYMAKGQRESPGQGRPFLLFYSTNIECPLVYPLFWSPIPSLGTDRDPISLGGHSIDLGKICQDFENRSFPALALLRLGKFSRSSQLFHLDSESIDL